MMCARHYFEYFTYINSFSPPIHPRGMMAASYSQKLQKDSKRAGKRGNGKANGDNITKESSE